MKRICLNMSNNFDVDLFHPEFWKHFYRSLRPHLHKCPPRCYSTNAPRHNICQIFYTSKCFPKYENLRENAPAHHVGGATNLIPTWRISALQCTVDIIAICNQLPCANQSLVQCKLILFVNSCHLTSFQGQDAPDAYREFDSVAMSDFKFSSEWNGCNKFPSNDCQFISRHSKVETLDHEWHIREIHEKTYWEKYSWDGWKQHLFHFCP